MKKLNLEKYALEMALMRGLPPSTIELPPLAPLAIITYIQLATRHPEIAGSEFAKIACDVARQLQKLFNPESETHKVLEIGWNPEHDFWSRPTTGNDVDVCEEPCEKLLADIPCPCTENNKIIELVRPDEDLDARALRRY
ncbi:MAG: hypothetical protein ICV80_05335 [Microcoleus sp. T1-bin1]|nr:hypothetical protein [Microcoleus sp. T1-bin1]MBD0339407.1 hypothetical protein [Microcoleus sp. Co-bin12]